MSVDPAGIAADIVENIETDTGNDMVDAAGVVWLAVSKALAPWFDLSGTGPTIDALSVLGRSTNTSGAGVSITAGSDGYVLRRSGTSLGFGAITTAVVTGLDAALAARPTGSGTANTVTKWTSSDVVGDSSITDNGSAVNVGATLNSAGNFSVATTKFTVQASTGNTGVLGDFAINTNKFTVAAATGNTVIAGTLALTPMTAGSILFTAASGVVTEDNAALYWDPTNNRLGIGTNTPGNGVIFPTVDIEGSATDTDSVFIRNTSATGYSAIQFWDSAGTGVGATGFGNASAGDTSVRSRLYWRTFGSNFVITTGTSTPSTVAMMLFNSTGNVNIGTTTSDPSQKLRVQGTATVTGNLTVTGTNGVVLDGQDRPFITRGWDAFSSGTYSGVGRWGMFMDPNYLTVGIPNIATANFRIAKWNADSSVGSSPLIIDSSGTITLANATATAGTLAVNYTPVAGTTSSLSAAVITNNGTYNTTATARTEYGLRAVSSSTRSSGANDLTNVALYATASGAQVNVALRTDSGNILLNQTGGTFSVAGAATFTSTVSIEGAATIGNAISDAHVINGGTLINAPAGDLAINIQHAATGQTASSRSLNAYHAGSYDTTAGVIAAYGITINVESTRSAGANDLTNYGLIVNSSGGQNNTAIFQGFGDNSFNSGSGSSTFHRNVSIRGNADIGDASGDAHTIAGNLTHTGASSSPYTVTNTPVALASDAGAITAVTAGTIDCTAAVRYSGVISAIVNSTRSGGANDLTNTGIYAEASGAQNNYALYAYNGGATATDWAVFSDGRFKSTGAAEILPTGLAPTVSALFVKSVDEEAEPIFAYKQCSANTDDGWGAVDAYVDGTFDTTAGNLMAYGVAGTVTSTRSAGGNNLRNIGVIGNASGAQENFSFFGVAGTLYNAGDFLLDGSAIIGSSVADSHAINGSTGLAGSANTDAFLAQNTQTGQTSSLNALYGSSVGSFDTTAGALNSVGVRGSVTSTRSAGGNNLSNIGLVGLASGAQVNWGVYGSGTQFGVYCDGALYVATTAQIDGVLSVTGVLDVNNDLAKFGATRDGLVYMYGNELNFEYADNATSTGYINYHGYNQGYTQFRNLSICDGKGAEAVLVTGSTKSLTLRGQLIGANGPTWDTGSGDPNGVVTAPVGSFFSRTDGGAGSSWYVKESGAGNTGWVAK